MNPLLNEFRGRFDSLSITGRGPTRQAAETQAQNDLMIQIRLLYQELSFRCDQARLDYDWRTRHGRTQGAQLRTRITARRARRP